MIRSGPTSVVIGAGGGIGTALAGMLEQHSRPVVRIGRSTNPKLDLLDEASIAAAAAAIGPGLHLVIDATGFLHNGRFRPEKGLQQIDPRGADACAIRRAIADGDRCSHPRPDWAVH